METTLHSHVNSDGALTLTLPAEFKDADVTVNVKSEADTKNADGILLDAKGRPPGFWKKILGSIPDFPDRAPQPEYEERESF